MVKIADLPAPDPVQGHRTFRALNIVTKWRSIFTGWQLGTRAKGDPEGDAVSDHRELTILMRIELNALLRVLLEKEIVTQDEWNAILEEEAYDYSKRLEGKFAGFRATFEGMQMDVAVAAKTMKGWRP